VTPSLRALALASGATALVYEVVWAKYLALYLGGTALAQTVVLAAFLGGLSLGNALLGAKADGEKKRDGRDFDSGEPEFEFAEGCHREQVRRGHQQHQTQRQQPQRRMKPVVENLPAGDRLEPDHDHPEVPIQPGNRKACPATEGSCRVIGERAGRRVRGRHLAQHPHHQNDQQTAQRVRQERGGPGVADHHTRADEQAGADHTAKRDHAELPLRQSLAQLRSATHG
jgi:hypothetical protein